MSVIAETLDRLRSERGELEDFMETMFSAMEDLGARLTRRQGDLSLQEAKLRERESQLASRQQEQSQLQDLLQQQASRLESMSNELQSVRGELAEQKAGSPGDAGDAHLQGVVQKLEEQRDDLKQRLDVCREELARRNDATEQLAKTQTQLAAAREEILQLREKIEQARDAGQSDSEAHREQVALETELEMVRRRAAELSETLAEQKDQMTQQQAMWAAELNHLRSLMDAHNGAWIDHASAQQSTGAGRGNRTASSAAGGGNAVVDSVMQQFAKLQKDVAQRRKRTSS